MNYFIISPIFLNKLGTYQIAIVAKALKKPFYVAVESYKFARMYPLNQRDATDMCGHDLAAGSPASVSRPIKSCSNNSGDSPAISTENQSYHHPKIDFTPAEFITLLFTDLGVLTPAAVSDELIKLYQ